MKCRKILLGIRDRREKGVTESIRLFSKISTDVANFSDELLTLIQSLENGKLETADVESTRISIESLIKKQQAIALLEFPYKTDAASVNSSLFIPKADKSLTEADWNRKYQENSLAHFMQAYEVKYSPEGQMISSPVELNGDDLQCALPQEILIKNIDNANLKKDSKRTYRSIARKIGLGDKQVGSLKVHRPPAGLDCDTLSIYFNYLEERCLNSDLLSHYHDLIGIRLLFYVPLETSLLNECTLSNINESTQSMRCTGQEYKLPQSFIELVKTTHKKRTPLLQRDTKQLTKLISRTCDGAGLKGKITATLIRRSQEFIAYQEGYVKEKLPCR